MSNRKKLEPQPEALPTIPSVYCDGYRYDVNNGIFTLYGGRNNVWHVALSLPIGLAIDLIAKLSNTVAPKPEETVQ